MVRTRGWFRALGAVGLIVACDGRDRTNPLDPLNDATNGSPDVLRAIADNGAVDLSWVAVPPVGFAAYELYRSEAGGPFELVRRTNDVHDLTHRDGTRVNNRILRYRLDVVLDDSERVSLPEKEATPGASLPWVLENAPFGAVRLSPDGRTSRARSQTFGVLFDADLDGAGGLWAVDYFGSELVHLDRQGEILMRVPVDAPYRVALDVTRSRAWVASWRTGLDPVLFAFDSQGREVARFSPSGEARDLAVDRVTGACYLALGRGGGIARAEVGSALVVFAPEVTPMMLARVGPNLVAGDPIERRLHAYDAATLVEAARDTVPAGIGALASLTPPSGGGDPVLWVADARGTLTKRLSDLTVVSSHPGVGNPTGLAIDPDNGALWLTLPSEGRIVRLDMGSGGTRTLALSEPFQVVVGTSD
jgi:sugar lactone lactonase YvrE